VEVVVVEQPPCGRWLACAYLEKRMAKLDMTLEVSDEALALLAEAGFDPVFGARPLKRAIQERIENPLSRLILDGSFGPKDHVRVGVKKGQLAFDKGVGKA